jgi:hypothetical protein
MKKYIPWLKKNEQDENEKKMMRIIKNCRKNNPNISKRESIGLCRVSFLSTYKEIFEGDIEKLWDEAK